MIGSDYGDVHDVSTSPHGEPRVLPNSLQPPLLSVLTDAELVQRAIGASGEAPDREAFGELYRRYRSSIFAFALSKLHCVADAEDITSQTFLQALKAMPCYEQRGLPIRSWFFHITFNLIAGLYRASCAAPASRRIVFGPDLQDWAEVLEPADPDAAAAIAACEGAEEFTRLIQRLTREQRMVLWLRFGDDLALAAIAQRTGRSEGSIKALQFRGLQEVRRRLEPARSKRVAPARLGRAS